MMYSLEHGKQLIKLARDAVSKYVDKKNFVASSSIKQMFSEPKGVFVTLTKQGNLRGCIGFPEPIYPLHEAIVKAAQSAASSDPRFPPLSKVELKEITIEVSVLTRPQRIDVRNPGEYLNHITIGKDGLIVRGTFNSGLLLPQVAVEYEWHPEMFLSQTCVKAGLNADSWHDFENCRVYKFQAQVFSEQNPGGEVKQLM